MSTSQIHVSILYIVVLPYVQLIRSVSTVFIIWDVCIHDIFSISCLFEGTREDMTEHLENSCKYEGLKGFLGRTEDQISDLTDELKRKDEEIMFLRSMLANLSEKVEHLEKSSEKQLG